MQHLAQMARQASSATGPSLPGMPAMPSMPPWMAAMMSQKPPFPTGQNYLTFPAIPNAPLPNHEASPSYDGDHSAPWNAGSSSSMNADGIQQQGHEPTSDGMKQLRRSHGIPLARREHSFRELPQSEGQASQDSIADPARSASFSFQQPPHDSHAFPLQPTWSGPGPAMAPPHSIPDGQAYRDPHSNVAAARDDSLLIPGARWVSPQELWSTQQQLQQEAAAAGPDMGLGGVPGQMLAVAGQMEPALFGTATAEASPAHGQAAHSAGQPAKLMSLADCAWEVDAMGCITLMLLH